VPLPCFQHRRHGLALSFLAWPLAAREPAAGLALTPPCHAHLRRAVRQLRGWLHAPGW
jgi:hypothetical protein